jgi:hypothetical protein
VDRIRALALRGDEHVRDHAGIVDRVRALDVDQVQWVEAVPSAGDAERVEDPDLLSHLPPTARGHRRVLRLHVHDERGAEVVEEVGDHRGDALPRAGRREREEMPVPVEAK